MSEILSPKNNPPQSIWTDFSIPANKNPESPIIDSENSENLDFLALTLKSLKNFENPMIQLDSIQDFSELLKTTHLETEELQQILQAFEEIKSNKNISPLYHTIITRLESCLETDYGLIEDRKQKSVPDSSFLQDLENQDQLAREYPSLTGYPIITIAPNVASSHNNYGQITDLAFKNPDEQPNINDILSQEDDSQGVDYYFLINLAHNIQFKPAINEALNINLSNIPLISQISLLKFMAKADNGRFNKLSKTLQHIDNENLRIALLENFVATDFGEDFGDALLDIANFKNITEKQKIELFKSISSCRTSITKITDLYKKIDNGEFSHQYSRATNERLTDVIVAFQEIAKNTTAKADLGWAGAQEFDFNSAFEALEYERKSLEIINNIITDLRTTEDAFAEIIIAPIKGKMKRTLYNIYSKKHGYCLLYTRPEGAEAYDPAFEYGNQQGVEASISFIVNPEDPFSLPNPFRPIKGAKENRPDTLNKVSAIRLDREGRTQQMKHNDPNRSPINNTGTISVDLAAIGDGPDTPSGKIARLISVGNVIRSKNQNFSTETSLNHNTSHFNQNKYGTEQGFKEIADFIDDFMTTQCEINPPKHNDQSFRRLLHRKTG